MTEAIALGVLAAFRVMIHASPGASFPSIQSAFRHRKPEVQRHMPTEITSIDTAQTALADQSYVCGRALAGLFAAVLVFATLVPQSRAGEIPGAGDPVLRTAAEAWLAGENLPAVETMAGLAREGNVAARLFLRSMEFSNGLRDFADLPIKERRALFQDVSGRGFGKSWVYVEDERGNPVARALVGINAIQKEEPEARREYAQVLLDAGERQAALGIFLTGARGDGYIAKFLSEITTPEDWEQFDVWLVGWTYAQREDFAESIADDADKARWMEGWIGDPWTDADERAFRSALDEERLVAVVFLSYRKHFDRKAVVLSPRERNLARMGDTINYNRLRMLEEAERPTVAETRAAGEWLIEQAEETPFLTPLVELCRQSCPQTRAMCVQTGAVAVGLSQLARNDSPLEALIPQEAWLASERARTAILYKSARLERYEKFGMGWLPVDQCYSSLVASAGPQR